MSDIQLFPQVARSKWGEDELGDAIQSSSPHVQFLLKELSEAERVAASDLKSTKPPYGTAMSYYNSDIWPTSSNLSARMAAWIGASAH